MLTCMSANFPIQFPSSMRGVWFLRLCGERRKHNNVRDEDSFSDKDTLCYYMELYGQGMVNLLYLQKAM